MVTPRFILILYGLVLATVAALYVFAATFSTLAHNPAPDVEKSIPIFVDLLKVAVGAVFGALSTALGTRRP